MRRDSLFFLFFLLVSAAGLAVGGATAYTVSAKLTQTLFRMEKRPLEMVAGETLSIASDTFHTLLDLRKEEDPVAVQTAKQDVLARIANYRAAGEHSDYQFVVLDHESTVLANSGPDLDLSSFSPEDVAHTAGELEIRDADGNLLIGYHRYFPAWRWHILSLVPESVLVEETRQILLLLLAEGFVGIVVFLSVSFLLMRRYIQKPLQGLVEYARKMESGSYGEAKEAGTGEIRQLSMAFGRMAQAIRERERALSDLAKFAASNPNLVMKVDPDGRILYANISVERMLHEIGLPTQHGEMLLPDDAAEIARGVLESRDRRRMVTYAIDGRTIEYTVFGFEDEESVLFHGVDVTEKKAIEEQLLHSQKMETLGRIAGGVAHDFNNLLAGILGYSSYLKSMRLGDERIGKAVDSIERAAERGAQLTRQLLGFARKGTHEHLAVDLNRVVEEAAAIVSQTFPKDIEIVQEKDGTLHAVRGDASQLIQCLMNLLVNARDAMPSGGTLRVSTRKTVLEEEVRDRFSRVPAGDYSTVVVEDRGHGMDEATLERIFDPFFTTKEKQKGTGLGMSLVYGIVKNHGGRIEVLSAPKRGTSVRIDLPAAPGEIPAAERSAFLPARDIASPAALTVLLVDDEELVRDVAGAMLSSLGFRVLTAADGREGVETFRREHAAIAFTILDLRMPVMDGKKAFEEIRRIDPAAQVVISTGFSGEEDVDRMKEMGAAAVLSKPYSYREIADLARTFERR